MQTPNWQPLRLQNQCGVCKHYTPLIKNDKLTARGWCAIRSNCYKQRTERCAKYEMEGVCEGEQS